MYLRGPSHRSSVHVMPGLGVLVGTQKLRRASVCLAQSVAHTTLDLWVVRSSSTLDAEIT